jgi:hypothetical protein
MMNYIYMYLFTFASLCNAAHAFISIDILRMLAAISSWRLKMCVHVRWDRGHILPTNLTGIAKKVVRVEPRKTTVNENVTRWH